MSSLELSEWRVFFKLEADDMKKGRQPQGGDTDFPADRMTALRIQQGAQVPDE